MFKCVGKMPRKKNFAQILIRKCVCKIPHPPKVELELGEETTTSHFSKPNGSTKNEFKFPCTSMNPRPREDISNSPDVGHCTQNVNGQNSSYDFLTSNARGSEPIIHLIFENHLTRSPYTRLIPVSCVLGKNQREPPNTGADTKYPQRTPN